MDSAQSWKPAERPYDIKTGGIRDISESPDEEVYLRIL